MKFGSVFAAALLLSVASAQAQSVTRARGGDVLESYTAYIGKNDLYNYCGERLTQPWQVIRQDRTNYHAFGIRDRGDEGDDFFSDVNNRERLERMVANG